MEGAEKSGDNEASIRATIEKLVRSAGLLDYALKNNAAKFRRLGARVMGLPAETGAAETKMDKWSGLYQSHDMLETGNLVDTAVAGEANIRFLFTIARDIYTGEEPTDDLPTLFIEIGPFDFKKAWLLKTWDWGGVMEALNESPVIDESFLAEVECEFYDLAWYDWLGSDVRRRIGDIDPDLASDMDDLEMDGVDVSSLIQNEFDQICEMLWNYPSFGIGGAVSINVDMVFENGLVDAVSGVVAAMMTEE